MKGTKREHLEDPTAWHNCFYREITSRIPESIFSVLYHEDNGRPNAPIRQLVGMLILKEGQDWTDEQLFEACSYNTLVCIALGMSNYSDEAPSPATYYNFKVRLLRHEMQTGQDLMEEAFKSLTQDQVVRFKVSGSHVRMDSKLVNSNIAKVTRLQLLIGILTKFYQSLSGQEQSSVEQADQEELKDLLTKSPEQHTFPLNKQGAARRLEQLGSLLYRLYVLFEGRSSEEYELLSRFWQEHFELKQDGEDDQHPHIELKEKPANAGSSIQSAHDPQAGYRVKEGSRKQIVRGYVQNITETCAPDNLHLITDVQTEIATTSDDRFFEPAIEATRQITNQSPENVMTDGGFNSQTNEKISKKEGQTFKWYVSAIQGTEGHYDFELVGEQIYRVTDRRTGLQQLTHRTPKGLYRIVEHHAKSKYRYFEEKIIINYLRRQAIKDYPQWVRGMRANVEATIRQVFCKLDGAKTRYRGRFKHHLYALCRSFWVNFTRIQVA
ncbi:transposase, partial [Arthrospira platensis SPKY1]|nr:transposase [Arthrospira platensis SPKY1]